MYSLLSPDEKILGPLQFSELEREIQSGRLHAQSLVSRGNSHWLRAASLPEVRELLEKHLVSIKLAA